MRFLLSFFITYHYHYRHFPKFIIRVIYSRESLSLSSYFNYERNASTLHISLEKFLCRESYRIYLAFDFWIRSGKVALIFLVAFFLLSNARKSNSRASKVAIWWRASLYSLALKNPGYCHHIQVVYTWHHHFNHHSCFDSHFERYEYHFI